jgi:hypothetical protein
MRHDAMKGAHEAHPFDASSARATPATVRR